MGKIEIRYRRPPHRLDTFVQDLIVDRPEYKITLHEQPPIQQTLYVGGQPIFEPGAPIVWFVFPDEWFDLGRFHLKDGTFTGYYVNLITPVEITGESWNMFDLCLDLWVDPAGSYWILDRDEFDEAVDRLWIDAATARRTRQELDRIIAAVRAGRWPPVPVRDYDLARVRELSRS